MAWSRAPGSTWNGLGFGLIAGGVLAVAECVAAWASGRSVLEPVHHAASVVLGMRALTEAPLAVTVAVGLGVHLALSAFFGLLYSLIDARLSPELRSRVSHQMAAGMLFALGVWVVTFQLLARAGYPWFLQVPPFPQLVLHAFFYGAPLGVLFAAAERRRTAIAVSEQRVSEEGAPQPPDGEASD